MAGPSGGSLEGKVAVVTGGAGLLGGSMVASFANAGATVVVADIELGRAEALAGYMQRAGHVAVAVELDVTSDESADQAFATIESDLGGVDVLVNNAMPSTVVAHDAPVETISSATWSGVFEGILGGILRCSQRAIPLMRARGGGSIINIGSVHGHAADRNLTAYPAAKAGVMSLSRSIATQYGDDGIRCNSVSPGTVPYAHFPEDLVEAKVRHQLVGRRGRPADIANVVLFLASPSSAFVTGTDIVADGGVLAHLPAYAEAAPPAPAPPDG